LPQVTAPITIFHGTDDGTFPYSNALRLKALLKVGDEFISIEGAGHNDPHEFPLFREKLDSVLRR
jgi:pimeloyl-ACP methyl ester carboxylesterase